MEDEDGEGSFGIKGGLAKTAGSQGVDGKFCKHLHSSEGGNVEVNKKEEESGGPSR